MKKRFAMIAILIAVLMAVSSCSYLSSSSLETMFGENGNSNVSSTSVSVTDPDSVVISRQEYERYQQFSELYELYDMVSAIYYQDTDPKKLSQYANRGLMAALDDPYSFYYNPEEFEAMWQEDEGNYVGIGVLISANYETQVCTIMRVFEGGPAEEVGVLRGDILYRVGEDLYVNANNLQEAVNIMKGQAGTDVDVTFLRNGEEITFTINRREVKVNRVESKMIDEEIGYIALYEFEGQGDAEFIKAFKKMEEKNIRGLIIDLRDNGGGWVDHAQNIADLFLDEQVLCTLKGREGIINTYRTKDGKSDVKLVILINENTASSSEILTGALTISAGAVTVGTKSFGKGIVQQIYPVGNEGAGVQITVAEYFLPDGTSIHRTGITPDYEVPLPDDDPGMYNLADLEKDVQLIKAVEVMREALQ